MVARRLSIAALAPENSTYRLSRSSPNDRRFRPENMKVGADQFTPSADTRY